ncbi:MAG TPA: hypothetical protein PK762_14515 [Candidatus Kapabacteria bacterium]|nr:hypothetical protein [Candidatus Kapabacteria bacterium]
MLPISSFRQAIIKPTITNIGKKKKSNNSILFIDVGLKPSPINIVDNNRNEIILLILAVQSTIKLVFINVFN